MSSNAYSTCLRADPLLRRWVLASGIVLAVIGALLILSTPFGPLHEVPLLGAWLIVCFRELWRLRQAYRRYRGLTLNRRAEIALIGREAGNVEGRLLPGSLVLRRYAWIRVRDGRGCEYGELYRGSCRGDPDWRRLQVLWRHIGAAA